LNLCIDIGNTRIKLGLFEQDRLVEQAVWPFDSLDGLSAWVAGRDVHQVIVCTVVHPAEVVVEALQYQGRIVVLDHTTPLPFVNEYTTPQTLGKDRLAAVAGAQHLWPAQDCMVIDCGTCIKYEVLSSDGRYHGGNIAPGLRMRTEAMHHFTARLPEVPTGLPRQLIGYDTTSALQNGAFRGALIEITGVVRAFQRSTKTPLKVILTGGDAEWIHAHADWDDLPLPVVEPYLTLVGLNAIINTRKN
jgi:type III pantothenate kinase